jgi:hypothetical protein
MGLDPVTIALIAGTVGAGASVYAASQNKPPSVKTPGAPPAPVEGGVETGKKIRKYRPAAQLFRDEDLRLGGAGKLGL